MKRSMIVLVAVIGLALAGVSSHQGVLATDDAASVERGITTSFEAIHIYLDSGATPLAAWQFELIPMREGALIVGVENGEHAAYPEPPFYDRKMVDAGKAERIVLAAYSLAAPEALPTGRTRIATIHMQVTGNQATNYVVELQAAADSAGRKFDAVLTFEKGTTR